MGSELCDILVFGVPSSGSTWVDELLAKLEEHGLKIGNPTFTGQLTAQLQSELIGRYQPKAVLFISWESCLLTEKLPGVPLMVAQPYRAFSELEARGLQGSIERKLTVLSLADRVLAPDAALRLYLAGWMVQAGRVPSTRDFISVIPAGEIDSHAARAALESLVKFVRDPILLTPCEPFLGSVCGRPSFLTAPGELSFRSFGPGSSVAPVSIVLQQRFIIPAENISTISFPLSTSSVPKDFVLELQVKRRSGRKLASRNIGPAELLGLTKIAIKLPVLSTPHGGEELLLELKWQAPSGMEQGAFDFALGLTKEVAFPASGGISVSSSALGYSAPERGALALGFSPGESTLVYRLKILAERAVQLIRQGQFKRFFRAIRRRVPELFGSGARRFREGLALALRSK